MLGIPDSELPRFLERFESQAKAIKRDIYKIAWYMRGGVTSEQLLYQLSFEDRELMNEIINTNIENTQKSGLPLL